MKNLFLARPNSQAYTLIEFLIYIFLSSVVSILFLSALNKAWLEILRVNKAQDAQLELALAGDVLRRDLQGASMRLHDWNESLFIFKKQSLTLKNNVVEEWVCWYVSDLGLMRADGDYDQIKNIWQSNDVSLVSKGVAKIDLKLKTDSNIVTAVSVSLWPKKALSNDKKLMNYPIYVSLRNRVLQ